MPPKTERCVVAMLPSGARHGRPEAMRQACTLVSLSLVVAVTGLAYVFIFALLRMPGLQLLSGTMAVVVIGALVAYRFGLRRQAAAHIVLMAMALVFLAARVFVGMDDAIILPWMMVVPVCAMLLVGGRGTLPWLLFVCASFIGLYLLAGTTWVPLSNEAAHTSTELALACRLGLVTVLTGVAWAHDANRLVAERRQKALEAQVRTAHEDLERSHGMARTLLDHVDHGIVLVNADGTVTPEHSRAAVTLLGPLVSGQPVWQLFTQHNPRFAGWLESCWLSADDGWMPLSLSLSQLPRQIELDGRVLAVQLRVIDQTRALSPVLFVATDVTEVVRARDAERASAEVALLLTRSVEDIHLVASFIVESGRLVAGVASGDWAGADQRRAVHTVKGTASVMGLAHLAGWLHELEERMGTDESGCDAADRQALRARWSALAEPLRPLLDRVAAGGLQVLGSDIDQVIDLVGCGAHSQEIVASLRMLKWEPVRPRLEHLARRANASVSVARPPVQTHVQCTDIRVPPTPGWTRLLSTLVHLVRNAMDHASESVEARLAAGKPASARIELRAFRAGTDVIVEVRDDGCGVVWEDVARRARAKGLPHATRDDLQRALFADGLSTRQQVTELSGRGVGLSAVAHAVHAVGGTVGIDSIPGQGVTVRITVPVWPLRTQEIDECSVHPQHRHEGAEACP